MITEQHLRQIADKIEEAKFDFFFQGGDMPDGHTAFEQLQRVVVTAIREVVSDAIKESLSKL